MRTRLPKVGDILEIRLPDGRYAYAHYVFEEPDGGPLVRVLEGIYDEPLPPEAIDTTRHRFWTYVGINPPVREGRWKIVGHSLVGTEERPLLRKTLPKRYWDPDADLQTQIWFLRRADEPPPGRRIGERLPREYWDLDWDGLVAGGDLEERIMTGRNFPWEEQQDAELRGSQSQGGETAPPPAAAEKE